LYDAVENSVPGNYPEAKTKALEAFLISAEARYMNYLALLEAAATALKRNHQQYSVEFVNEMPLPPWFATSLSNAGMLR
jgi:hypothetical protein